MTDDIDGIERTVAGFSKIPDKHGEFLIEVEYKLKPLKLSFLQELFNVDPNQLYPGDIYLIDCYEIKEKHAIALQPYVIDGVIDLDKYYFQLECSKAD